MSYRQAQWITRIKVDGTDLGRFKSWEGGGADSESSTYENWDGTQVLGGRKTRDEGTAKRLYREEDHKLVAFLEASIGRGAEITRVPIGDDGVPWGDPVVLTGRLKSVKIPDHDQAQDDGGELELGFTLNTDLA